MITLLDARGIFYTIIDDSPRRSSAYFFFKFLTMKEVSEIYFGLKADNNKEWIDVRY